MYFLFIRSNGEPDLEINTFDGIFNIFISFKGTVVNRALESLNGGSLELTLTVPLKGPFSFLCYLRVN